MSAEIQPVRIFIAYSSKDLEFQRELKNHLEPLIRNKRIVLMDNYAINPGDNWDEKIGQMLDQSDIVLLLLSADALASPHFFREAAIAIERRRRGQTDIIPVKLRPCDLDDEPLLQELDLLEVLPEKDVPVVKWQHRDEAYLSIVQGLKKVLRVREEAAVALGQHIQQQKEYADLIGQAKALMKKKMWEKAQTLLDDASTLWQEGFAPERTMLEILKIKCNTEIEIIKNIILKIREYKQTEKKRFSDLACKEIEKASHNLDPFTGLMISVKGGRFDMGDIFGDGSSNERPVHSVTVSDFQISKYLVTQKQWKDIMGNSPSDWDGDCLPIDNVSWYDAHRFIKKLNNRTGKRYRLPTEAEWEYSARECGKKVRFGNGKNFADPHEINYGPSDHCRTYAFNCRRISRITIVGSFPPNALGLYDMSGNIREWCEDAWHDNYVDAPDNSLARPSDNKGTRTMRLIRGGGWDSDPYACRTSHREKVNVDDEDEPMYGIGFRLAHD